MHCFYFEQDNDCYRLIPQNALCLCLSTPDNQLENGNRVLLCEKNHSESQKIKICIVQSILGDADGNGIVNISDTTVIQRYLTSFSVLYSKETLMNADVDGNGVLTILDATLIQRHLAKIDTPYPIGEPKT